MHLCSNVVVHTSEQNTLGSEMSTEVPKANYHELSKYNIYISSHEINIQELAEMIKMDDQGNAGENQGQEKCSKDIYNLFIFKCFAKKIPLRANISFPINPLG